MKRSHTPTPPVPMQDDPGTFLVPLSQGMYAKVSAEDADAVGAFTWFVKIDTHTSYARRTVTHPDKTRHTQSLHRFIAERMGLPADLHVDHINSDGLDCRRENLRSATPSESVWNTRLSKVNKSGYKGVFRQSNGRWRASLKVNHCVVNLGTFSTAEDANAALLETRRRLHGAYARNC